MFRKPSIHLMPEGFQSELKKTERNITGLSELSVASSASEFLEGKIQSQNLQLEYLRTYKSGLQAAHAAGSLETSEFTDQIGPVMDEFTGICGELKVLKRQRKILEEDLEEETSIAKRQRLAHDEPDITFLERAYTDSIVPRVMGASAKQKKSDYDQSAFRKDVINFYGAGDGDYAFCHLTGWWDRKVVKAAYLVPKSLSEEEVSYLFGTKQLILSDAKNGITLHEKIECALDQGNIAILPVPDSHDTWKCVLVNEDMRNLPYLVAMSQAFRWGDLDGKKLEFLTPNRPAKRFLYFRFISTYLNAKKNGNIFFTEKVDSRQLFWASPGPYLRRSTLTSLTQNIFGCELPPHLLNGNTFENDEVSAREGEDMNLVLSSEMRKATIASAARGPEDEDSDMEDEESDC